MTLRILLVMSWLACQSFLSGQGLLVIGGLENQHIHQQDSLVVISTFGAPYVHTQVQNNLVVTTTFIPFLLSSDSITSTSFITSIEGLRVFPNPTPDILVMQRTDITEDLFVTVADQTGKVVNDFKWPSGVGSYQPSFQSFPPGIYYISITNFQKSKGSQYKIIKQ